MKRSCGQVPTRYERQTFESVMDSWALREGVPVPTRLSAVVWEVFVSFLGLSLH